MQLICDWCGCLQDVTIVLIYCCTVQVLLMLLLQRSCCNNGSMQRREKNLSDTTDRLTTETLEPCPPHAPNPKTTARPPRGLWPRAAGLVPIQYLKV
jgi:hypothetical protein